MLLRSSTDINVSLAVGEIRDVSDLVLEPSFTKREEINNFQLHRL